MVRKISKEDHDEINSWYYEWNMPPLKDSEFPKLGFTNGIAAGFLVQTDSMVCFLDGYISNREALKEDREKAICEITEALLQSAKDLGFKRIIAISTQKAILKYCDMHGFLSTDYFVKIKEL